MNIFKYWKLEKQTILIDGEPKDISCYGGSNVSLEDASRNAFEKIALIQRKIEGEQDVFEDYEVEIREEILDTVDEGAVITRNRYGASVLNAERLLILDIDKPKLSLGDLFKRRDSQQAKAKIFEMVRKQAANPKYAGLGFRVYETFQGARVIVLGRDFDARDPATVRLMQDFNSDPLYTLLCQRQRCFRARLSPKPSRMKIRGRRVKFPRPEADPDLERWLADYERTSYDFGTCKFVEQVGAALPVTEVVRLHDELTKAYGHQRLA